MNTKLMLQQKECDKMELLMEAERLAYTHTLDPKQVLSTSIMFHTT